MDQVRKSKTIIIDTKDRDEGKMFILHEMFASQAEEWAIKAFLALAKSGVDIPDDISERGWAGIAILGLKALSQVSFYELKPLLDEMFQLIAFVPDQMKPNIKRGYGGIGNIVEDDIQEVSTRLLLRKEMLNLHTDFFTRAAN